MSENQAITGAQVRMAKAALGWTNIDLSKRTGLHRNTINKAQNGTARASTYAFLKVTFEAAGVEFISKDESSESGGPGVRLKE